MAINPSQISVGEIFGKKKYMVDFYQREYKWNDSVQTYKPIKSLLDDIFYRFELCYQKQSEVNEKTISSYDWYYLNSFMTNTLDGHTFIVDGQQRLTTLTVLIICLYHTAEKLRMSEGIISNIRKRICDFDDNGNMVFWVGFDDRKNDFKIVVSDTQAYKQFGNSVVVPVIQSIARIMIPHVLKLKSKKRTD